MDNRAGDYPPGESDRRVSYLVVRECGRRPIDRLTVAWKEGRTITCGSGPPCIYSEILFNGSFVSVQHSLAAASGPSEFYVDPDYLYFILRFSTTTLTRLLLLLSLHSSLRFTPPSPSSLISSQRRTWTMTSSRPSSKSSRPRNFPVPIRPHVKSPSQPPLPQTRQVCSPSHLGPT